MFSIGFTFVLLIPLCLPSPIRYYKTKDFEPPALDRCPGPKDGFYPFIFGNCEYYIECMYVGTSMEMAWIMPCIPGSFFQYPSVCDQCSRANVNDNKISFRQIIPPLIPEQQNTLGKSTPTTSTHATTPTTTKSSPHIKESSRQELTTVQRSTTGNKVTALPEATTLQEVHQDKTTVFQSTMEGTSTEWSASNDRRQLPADIDTKDVSPSTTEAETSTQDNIRAGNEVSSSVKYQEKSTVANMEETTMGNAESVNTQTKTANPTAPRRTEKTESPITTTTTDDYGTNVPKTELVRKSEQFTTGKPEENKETTSASEASTTETNGQTTKSADDYTTASENEETTKYVTKGKFTHENEVSTTPATETSKDNPESTESLLEQSTTSRIDKDTDRSKSNAIKSAQLSEVSNLSVVKATTDVDQLTTLNPHETSDDYSTS